MEAEQDLERLKDVLRGWRRVVCDSQGKIARNRENLAVARRMIKQFREEIAAARLKAKGA